MLPWRQIDDTRAPNGAALTLHQRGDEFVIRVDGAELMSSRRTGSESALGAIACTGLGQKPGARVLIGGLGIGFTLRAALDTLSNDAAVTVVELVPAVVEWNRGPLAALAGRPLDDPRVAVAVADVGAYLAAARTRFDAIILDVDNGPEGLTRPANQALYGDTGLRTAKRALRPGGRYAVWSASAHRAFERHLARAGFEVKVHRARSGRGGPRHVVYLGVTPAPRLRLADR